MARNKTQATEASVEEYLAAIADALRQNDCRELVRLMSKVTKQPATLWGSSIVGFGRYQYRYASGREGETCVIGFASRAGDISLYGLTAATDAGELLSRLGKHKTGKSCLYIRRLSDIDITVLEKLMLSAVAANRPDCGAR